ncbi:MAG: CBS domain-containing protein, partial [Chlamydiota bacterium]
ETAPRLHRLSKVIFPIVRLLEWSTKKVISYFPSSTRGGKEGEEGDLVIDNTLTPLNRQYILNMVKIDQTKVKDIFHEWEHVDFIHESSSIEELEKMLITSGHTRLPVEKDGEVIGVLNSKEFFAFQKTGQTTWLNLVRKPVKMQTNTLILNALKVLQSGGTAHMAIVYRGKELAGIVTMEDIFEEIVGDIYDEDDHGSIEKILSRTKY